MRYRLICSAHDVTELAEDAITNKEQITAFRKTHEECGNVKVLPLVGSELWPSDYRYPNSQPTKE